MNRRIAPVMLPSPAVAGIPEQRIFNDALKLVFLAARGHAEIAKAALRWQVDSLSFLVRRGQETVKLVDDLTDDDDFADAFDISAAYVQNAVLDLAEEACRIAAAGPRIVAEMAHTLRQRADTLAEDMAAGTLAT